MREAEGRFLRQVKGLGGFMARVTVRAEPEAPAPSIEVQCSGRIDPEEPPLQGDAEDVPAEGYDDWKAGAVAGAEYALASAGRQECHIVITRILGMTTDTNPTVVAVAAVFAVWSDLGYQPLAGELKRLEEIVFANRKLSLDAIPKLRTRQ